MRSISQTSLAASNFTCLTEGGLKPLVCCLTLGAAILFTPTSAAASPQEPPSADPKVSAEMEALYAKFAKLLTGAKLRGQFTVDGRPMDKLSEEIYEIEKAEKQPDGDAWIITARIKYGKWDLVFPCPVEVKWADKTPVITLDDLTIPGMGKSFGARVLFHKDKYAGTWSHGDVGGHMFGKIEFKKADRSENPENE
jgi:hypothetical protein